MSSSSAAARREAVSIVASACSAKPGIAWGRPPGAGQGDQSQHVPGNRNAVGNEYIVTTSRRPGAADRIQLRRRKGIR
jgi:hypothetical protein